MLNAILRVLIYGLLRLRYRIRIRGLDKIRKRGTDGVLFLPNHPALIDPIILITVLHKHFRAEAVADRDQVDRFFIRRLARRANVRPIPSVGKLGVGGAEAIKEVLGDSIEALRRGENVLIYPSGHVYRHGREDLRGNSAAHTIVSEAPGARVVLVRTTGLWGSGFSHASGHTPDLGRVLRRGLRGLAGSLLVFAPRREVTVTFAEPEDLPRDDRAELNQRLEDFYNQETPPPLYVPYSIWERGGPREMDEPEQAEIEGDVDDVPEATRELVADQIREISGVSDFSPDDRLAYDLGMDSIARADLLLWLEGEFGFGGMDVESLRTVGDVMLAATGRAVGGLGGDLKRVPDAWAATDDKPRHRLRLPEADTVLDAFLARAKADPHRPILADQNNGVLTNRDVLTRALILRPIIARLPGDRVGIMLPASTTATICYLAALAAGKTPVMINWTVGTANLEHCLALAGVQRVLTSEQLVRRVENQGMDFGGTQAKLFMLESLRDRIKLRHKLWAAIRARLTPGSLRPAKVADTAAVLFTSGSETKPKGVPLSHRNVLSNLSAVLEHVEFRSDDKLLGFLPPFHSFGLISNVLAPLCAGLQVACHANPTEGAMIGRLIEAYKATMVLGTPTFLSGIIRGSSADQLRTLRIAVTGAEKCPARVYDMLEQTCPQVTVLEGYGVTECSPIISANTAERVVRGSIGSILPGYEHAIVDVDSEGTNDAGRATYGRRVDAGEAGMLLVRGPSVFAGYLRRDGEEAAAPPDPFAEFDGQTWYRTGDLVSEEGGILTFRGRLKRFEKIGGEMISLPAIESALEPHYADDANDGPAIAVTARPGTDPPQLVLVTTRDTDRETVNRHIRDAGLSPLHNVREVVRIEEIPTLGTGKTDYRALAEELQD